MRFTYKIKSKSRKGYTDLQHARDQWVEEFNEYCSPEFFNIPKDLDYFSLAVEPLELDHNFQLPGIVGKREGSRIYYPPLYDRDNYTSAGRKKQYDRNGREKERKR